MYPFARVTRRSSVASIERNGSLRICTGVPALSTHLRVGKARCPERKTTAPGARYERYGEGMSQAALRKGVGVIQVREGRLRDPFGFTFYCTTDLYACDVEACPKVA